MTFEHDVFISYAHLDNQELIEGQKGWIANFHRAFEIRVGQYLGKQPQIWRDLKLQGNDIFAEALVTQVQHSAIMISVLSPRYVRSEWTQREVAEFLKAENPGPIVDEKHRIFKILKTPVPLDQHPQGLQGILGYEFFQTDPETGRHRELDQVFGPGAQREFWIKVDDVAQDVCHLLQRLEAKKFEIDKPTGSEKRFVFLAVPTSDATELRETLRRDLQQHGYEVLPLRPLGINLRDVEATVREDLCRCVMSVHLLSSRYGVIPEDGMESIPEIQSRLAVERARESSLIRLSWILPQMHTSDDRQSRFVERLRTENEGNRNSDLLETPFEDLRTFVQDRLKSQQGDHAVGQGQSNAEARLTRLYYAYDRRDVDSIEPWLDFLFTQGLEILHPFFEGDETEVRECQEEHLRSCDTVLIHYGAGNEVWLRRKLSEIQKIVGLGRTVPMGPVGIIVAPPMRPEKRLFRTHAAALIPQMEGFSPEAFGNYLTLFDRGRTAGSS